MRKAEEVIYELTQAEKMLHYINVWFLPFRWGANTYRGCEHDCVYCNARYTHEYLGLPTGEFAHKIFVKEAAAATLDKEFSREKWKKMTVNLATVTDPYQPAENRFLVTRDVLEIFLKHHNPLLLTTKSDLVLRDIDVLTQISQTGFLNVVIGISTLDDDLRSMIEPRTPSVERRLEVIQKLHEAGVTVGVAAIPLLPYITDNEKDVNRLIDSAAQGGADYVIVDLLNFRGEARGRYNRFLEKYDSSLIPAYEKLYQGNYCDKSYARKIRIEANKSVRRYKVDKYQKMYSFKRKKGSTLQTGLKTST